MLEAVRRQARARAAGKNARCESRELRTLLGTALQGYAEHAGVTRDTLMGGEWATPSPYTALEWLLLRSALVVPLPDAEQLLAELEDQGPPQRVPVREDTLGCTSIPWWAGEVVRDRLGVQDGLHLIVARGGFTAGECQATFPPWRHADSILDRLVDLEQLLVETDAPPPAALEA